MTYTFTRYVTMQKLSVRAGGATGVYVMSLSLFMLAGSHSSADQDESGGTIVERQGIAKLNLGEQQVLGVTSLASEPPAFHGLSFRLTLSVFRSKRVRLL